MPLFKAVVRTLPVEQTLLITLETDSSTDVPKAIDQTKFELLSVEAVRTEYPGNAPHVKFEYDEDYYGGDYDQVGDYAYVPLALIETFLKAGYRPEDAFTASTEIEACHIITHYLNDGDELCTGEGDNWFEAAEEWAEQSATELLSTHKVNQTYLAVIENDGTYDLELEVNPDEVLSTYATETADLELVRTLANRVEAELRNYGLAAWGKREQWLAAHADS